jgi:hypothetical protein
VSLASYAGCPNEVIPLLTSCTWNSFTNATDTAMLKVVMAAVQGTFRSRTQCGSVANGLHPSCSAVRIAE